MSNNWTDKQLEAINIRQKNLLVSAAAGSGKTAVLVERIAKLIENDGEDIESMLIVTFTNAAARQMKDRIQKKLQARLRELDAKDSLQAETMAFLRKQIRNIGRASISTVHSFCIDILRQNFQIVDIDPSFKIANESLISILKSKALEMVFEENYNNENRSFLDLVDAFGGEKSDKGLIEAVNQIHYFIQAQPYPKKWLEFQAKAYDFSEFKDSVWAEEIVNNNMGELKELLESCEEAIELCKVYSPPLAYIENLEDDKSQLEVLKANLETKAFEVYFQNLQAFKQSRLKTITKKTIEANAYDESLIEQIKEIRSGYIKEEMKSLSKVFGEVEFVQLLDDIKYMSPFVKSLSELVLEFDQVYRTLKMEKGVLDFSDIEHYTLKILEDEKVSQSLKQKYKYIFFDEYQDSNLVQETIIDAIKREDNLFFVGDVKQSIYRFRLSDPNLFNERYKKYSQESIKNSQKIDLSKNFRSRAQILEFCNLVFKNIMTREHGEVDYQDKSHQLEAGKESSDYEDHIELAIIEKKAKDNEDEALLENDELEAVYCCQKINELVSNQNIEYKDIAILMRSPKGKAKTFEKILNKYNIPCYVDFQSSSFSKVEIKCIIDYLKVIENHNQDEALLGAMTSVFGGFTTDDIIEIRINYPNLKFYEAVVEYSRSQNKNTKDESTQKDKTLVEKLNKFYSNIEEYRFLEKLWKLSDFIGYVLENSNYLTYVSGLQDSKQRLLNIKSFIEKAREYEADEASGLLGFLNQIDKILKEKGDSIEKTTLAEAENAVTIMSIHKSKGLEFDTVFLCDLGKRINEIDLRSDIILHNELGIGMKYKNIEQNIQSDSIPRNCVKLRKSLENISEEIRILYVALTRAIDRLYMVGSVSDTERFKTQIKKGTISQVVKKQKNYLAWISAVVEREVCNFKNINLKYIKSEELSQLEAEEVLDKDERKATILNYNFEDKERKLLFSKIGNFEYPYQKDTQLPNKRTVTELTKSYELEDIYNNQEIKLNKIPLFLQTTSKFSNTELGTITHMIMEKISMKSHTTDSIEMELQNMVDKELLTQEEKDSIQISSIVKFFESDLGKRLINAKELYREQSFLMKDEDTLIEGVIDCYFIEADGKIVLVDYKTDKVISEEKYHAQLKMYQKALEEAYKIAVDEIYIYWLSHDVYTAI